MPGDPGLPGASEETLSPLDMLTMVQSSEEGSMGLSRLRNPANSQEADEGFPHMPTFALFPSLRTCSHLGDPDQGSPVPGSGQQITIHPKRGPHCQKLEGRQPPSSPRKAEAAGSDGRPPGRHRFHAFLPKGTGGVTVVSVQTPTASI